MAGNNPAPEGWLKAGAINGVFGVAGWVKVFSNTDPIENITRYKPWKIFHKGEWRDVTLKNGRRQGKTVVALLDGVVDCDEAQQFIGAEIAVPQDCLPKLRRGEYYWTDLLGLQVVNTEGVALGRVAKMLETGSNDVMVVRGDNQPERLVPWVLDNYIVDVDQTEKTITVDWDPEF